MKTTACSDSAILVRLLSCILAFTLVINAHAIIDGPYAPDSLTLHLYHLDETATPSPDAATGGTNLVGLLFGATLGNPSYSGFGNALNTLDGGQDVIAAANKDALITASPASPPGNVVFPYCDPVSGAFTFEAIVWIGFDPTKNLGTTANGGNNRNSFCQIMSCESANNANRIFQFRICPTGVAPGGTGNPTIAPQPLVTFENIRTVSANQPTIFASIPTNGPDAIVSNSWYHVAVTYNGIPNTTDNIKFYWTLLDPSRTAANQIAITSVQNTLNGPLPLGTATSPFLIGNIGRNVATAGANFLGYVDEVRISKIARATNGMMFSQPEPQVLIPPSDVTVVQGNPASLTVLASGAPTLSYQWRHAGTNLPGATFNSLSIVSVQPANTGAYDVVITNSVNAITSPVANIIIRVPVNLTWIGSAGAFWNTSLINWDTNADSIADSPYTQGDNVTFDSAGSAVPVVTLTNSLTPHAVTVNASTDYTLTTTGGGSIGGFSQLTKSGSGQLIMDVDNTFIGPSTIQSGTLQVGTGGSRGSLGNGPITNNGALVIFRPGTLNLTDFFVGSGPVTNNATNTITLSGTNLSSGPITLNAGALVLANAQAKGNSTQYALNATANSSGPTRLTIGGGISFGPAVTISCLGTTASPDYRCTLSSSDSTNTLNCNLVLGGDGTLSVSSDGPAASSFFNIVGSAVNSPNFGGKIILRGGGNGLVTSQINIGGHVSKTDGGTWTITSTGNSWTNTDVAAGTLKMGANNVFPSTTSLNFPQAGTAVLDLAGFNQQVALFQGVASGVVGSSSTSSDCTLSINPPGTTSLFNGTIQNSVSGGTRKVGLTVTGGDSILSGTNTYTGDTTVASGALLEFFQNGAISNSANIIINDSGTMSAVLRVDSALTINPGQTLKANGAANINGNLNLTGNVEFNLTKAGATLTNDSFNGISTVSYGGALHLHVTASPAISTSDTFKLFNAGGYAGSFAEIVPVGPSADLLWDTSTLASDGTLRIIAGTVPPATNITAQVSGNQLTLSWPAANVGSRLQSQTNSINAGLSANWVDVPGSTTNTLMTFPINPANGSVFFRLVYP